MRFSVYQLSRKGGRQKNEDRVGYCYTRDCGLFAVADGMGGHPEGEVASRLALQALAAVFQRDAVPALAEPSRFLLDAVLAGHRQLQSYAARQALVDTPRTTVVACILQGNSAYWAHCGDSRLYLVRGERLIGRTRDHSYSELQEAMSSVLPARERYNRNVLFTCLGGPAKPVVDTVGPLQLQPGDRFLLCSDGLWGNVSDTVISSLLSSRSIAEAVPELVDLALRNGGEHCDNVTALAIEWESSEAGDDPAGMSTRALGDDVFASTIQAGPIGPGEPDGLDELDDDEIERSIREINEAIRRSSRQRKT